MSAEERRDGPRLITELFVSVSAAKGGEVIDKRATAHDVSPNGFRLETQSQLAEKTDIVFVIDLPGGRRAKGSGRVVWANRDTWATWAGVEITSMSWGDRRMLKAMLYPERVDLERLAGATTRMLIALVILTALHRLIYSPLTRDVLSRMAPKIVALAVAGWALVQLARKERR